MTCACLAVLVAVSAVGAQAAAAPGVALQAEPKQGPPQAAPAQEPPLPQAAVEAPERGASATPGAPTISLAAAVRLALQQAFALLDSQDAVAASRWRERTAFADFLPSRHAGLPARRGPERLRRRPLPARSRDGRHAHRERPLPERPEPGRALPAHDRPQAAAHAAAAAGSGAERELLRAQERAAHRAGPGAQPGARATAHRGRGRGGLLRGDRRAPAARGGAPEPGAHGSPAEVLRGSARGGAREQAGRVPRGAAGGTGA